MSSLNIFCILNSDFVCDFYVQFIGKRKQQAVEKHSNVSLGGTYNTSVYQPPNPYSYTDFTSANLYGQSYSPWTMHSQVLSIF